MQEAADQFNETVDNARQLYLDAQRKAIAQFIGRTTDKRS